MYAIAMVCVIVIATGMPEAAPAVGLVILSLAAFGLVLIAIRSARAPAGFESAASLRRLPGIIRKIFVAVLCVVGFFVMAIAAAAVFGVIEKGVSVIPQWLKGATGTLMRGVFYVVLGAMAALMTVVAAVLPFRLWSTLSRLPASLLPATFQRRSS